MSTASAPSHVKHIPVFFYGSFMGRDMLARGGFHPEHIEVARLNGYDISFSPYAHISRSDQHSIYGILTQATHQELDALYLMSGIGLYLPEPVIVEARDGALRPALYYIAPAARNEPADRAYVALLAEAAREHGFPDWYVARLGHV